MNRRAYLLLLLCIIPFLSRSQLVLDNTLSAEELGEALVGGGVEISNVTIDCPNLAYGAFDASATDLGVNAGLILTTGTTADVAAPSSSFASVSNGAAGDIALSILADNTTNDACIFELDVTVTSDTLKFNYVFGSEEYPEFVCSGFNDVFAFFISGPGIAGNQNIALVPGTTIPVAINTVNGGTGSGSADTCILDYSEYYIDNTGDPFLAYDGFTTVLEARAVVEPCETYHLKLAIADAGDFIYDSGVFIEAGSLTSTGVTISSTTSVGFGFDSAIEECVDGIFTFNLDNAQDEEYVLHFQIGGTADNGIDYASVADSVVFAPGETEQTITILPVADGLPEFIETVTVYLVDPCFGLPVDSATLEIQDEIYLQLNVPADTTICPGESIQLDASGGFTYNWTPEDILSDPTAPDPIATPSETTTFVLTTIVGFCSDIDSVTVNVNPVPVVDAGLDQEICIGGSTMLDGSGSGSLNWSPPGTLDDPVSATPVANPDMTTTYILTVTDDEGCQNTDEITLVVNPLPDADAGPDQLVCFGDAAQLDADGGILYTWEPAGDVSDPNIEDPTAVITGTTTFTVTVVDANGCVNTDEVTIELDPVPVATVEPDSVIYLGETVELTGTGGGNFTWTPTDGLSDPFSLDPIAMPDQTTTYVLTVASPIAGCESSDSVTITVIQEPLVLVPNAFSPNFDGINDQLTLITRGDIAQLRFQIFNRWGELVFETNSPDIGWDGVYNGESQNIGSYVYQVIGADPAGNEIMLSGNITLLK